jgi:preprotein translocase SecE subunit
MDTPQERTTEAPGQSPSVEPRPSRAVAAGPVWVLKPGQGTHVRWGSAVGAGVIAVAAAYFAYQQGRVFIVGNDVWADVFRTLVPIVVLLVLAGLTYWAVGWKRPVVEFMIATEGEMKKVNWSSRREVLGATRVVIVTTLALGFLLFAVDFVFMIFFSAIGVLKIPIFEQFFGSTPG